MDKRIGDLTHALSLMQTALSLIDRANVAHEVAAHLDLAISRLSDRVGEDETTEKSKRREAMDSDILQDLIDLAEVKLSAFAVCKIGEDWRLRVDALDSAICHFVASGEGYLEFGDQRVPIARGSIILVPPHTPKSISGAAPIVREVSAVDSCSGQGNGLLLFKASGEKTALIIGCASVAAPLGGNLQLLGRLTQPIVVGIRQDWFTASLDALRHELTRPDIGSRVIAECLMKQGLVLLLREQLELGAGSPLLASLGDSRLLRPIAAILKNPGAPHTMESLAKLAGMSRSSFMAGFAEKHGKTVAAFVEYARMHSAARLLHSSQMPVECLAEAVGYASRSQFERTFEQTFDVDPTAYRQRGRHSVDGNEVF